MKIIHYLNVIIYSLSVFASWLSYQNENFTGYMILSLIVLGISQPILALLILFIENLYNKPELKFVKYYWLGVINFFLTVLLISIFHLDNEFIFKIMYIIPPTLATYFVFVTYKIQK